MLFSMDVKIKKGIRKTYAFDCIDAKSYLFT
jgi:hypothetical protein